MEGAHVVSVLLLDTDLQVVIELDLSTFFLAGVTKLLKRTILKEATNCFLSPASYSPNGCINYIFLSFNILNALAYGASVPSNRMSFLGLVNP